MLFWWIVFEILMIAFFVYGYVIYKRRVRKTTQADDRKMGDFKGDE